MSVTDPNLILKSMGAKTSNRKVLVHIIGIRRRLRFDDGTTSRAVPMLDDAPPIIVHCTDVGFAPPTDAEKAQCLAYWMEHDDSPDSFSW
jgi:hypothetical protein